MTAIDSRQRARESQLMALIGVAHLISHFCQLLLAPLFPWLKDAFGVSYAQLGFLLTLFFVVSCCMQMLSGFLVDRWGPRPVLYAGLGLLALSAFGFAASTSYAGLAVFSVVAGVGNGVFHPVDYTLLNRHISAVRLGHAYSVHGISGSLGWALAPVVLVPVASAFSWRWALVAAGMMVIAVLVLLLLTRNVLDGNKADLVRSKNAGAMAGGGFGFLTIPAVWMCFVFFLLGAVALSVVQTFAPDAARHLHGMPVGLMATCLTVYMVCSAAGMVLGGFLAAQPEHCERVIGVGFGVAASLALVLGFASVPGWLVPVIFGLMGFCAGTGNPSRDLIVKRATPPHATGRVYGVVYSGLDIGQALAPLFFGSLMDHQQFSSVFVGLAVAQGALIFSAFRVRHARRTPLVQARAA
ncbi:MAG: hypothetical protein RLZZ591_443 [Pseudomonadota bacterium]|jgi:MFS family permease